LPKTQIVSIAHHEALVALHPRQAALVADAAGHARLAETAVQEA
jgi:ABC-type uncharacterized transport system fused permease/ATPase subunit